MQGRIGCVAHLQNALCAVMLDFTTSEDFRQIACGKPAQHVHLPQSVLRCHISLRDDKVVHGLCCYVGDAMPIAADRHRLAQLRHANLTVQLR